MVVKKQPIKQGLSRQQLGREKFIERVWQWKEISESRIVDQLRRLGASCDWSRLRFTLDDGLSSAVREVFVRMYREGLIYRGKRLVNWDPILETAISDLEVVSTETKGNLWHIAYKCVGREDREGEDSIVIATTRPETLFGDSAVAVNPEDPRYKNWIGRRVVVPIVNREVEIIADNSVDMALGSGALKVTPAHDHVDFVIGKRHNLEFIEILTPQAHLRDEDFIPQGYVGLTCEKAREKILSDLSEQGYLVSTEEISHKIPIGDRSGAVIEPYLSDQWFINTTVLAEKAISAVEEGEIKFVPSFWENTYFSWMQNIEPWCISRQLWWGHRIPVWYGHDGKIFVATSEDEAYQQARDYYKTQEIKLKPEEDVLDTWFSSALWPFSTLDWTPDGENHKQQDYSAFLDHYPTDVLLTGFDIIFFWVARMIMVGFFATGKKPFHTVYVHALVRDAKGQKMSKSKGNVLDPIELLDKYGCDALRFSLAVRAIPGRDIKIAEAEVEIARNLVTKIWNAARFCAIREVSVTIEKVQSKSLLEESINSWLLTKLHHTGKEIENAFANYRFDLVCSSLSHFLRDDFCDWYLEWCKIGESRGEVSPQWREVAGYVLGVILHWIHPIMPYVSEELWSLLGGQGMLIRGEWPDFNKIHEDAQALEEMEELMKMVRALRALKSEIAGVKINQLQILPFSEMRKELFITYTQTVSYLSRVGDVIMSDNMGRYYIVLSEGSSINFEGLEKQSGEIVQSLNKDRKKMLQELSRLEGRLKNHEFLEKAGEEVVEESKRRLDDVKNRLILVEKNISILGD